MRDPGTEYTVRMAEEDTLHVGATRPIMLLHLPMPLAIALMAIGYMIQTNVTGWTGLGYAVAFVAPCWVVGKVLVAHDPFGMNVALAWLRTCFLLRDRKRWGGATLSPLPLKYKRKAPL